MVQVYCFIQAIFQKFQSVIGLGKSSKMYNNVFIVNLRVEPHQIVRNVKTVLVPDSIVYGNVYT